MYKALKFFKEFKASSWVRAVSTLSLSALIAQSLILLVTPILSRLYNPEDFAALAVFMAIYLIVGVAANLKYDQAIMLPKHNEVSKTVFLLGILISIIVGLFLLFLFFLSFYFIESVKNLPSYFILSMGCLMGIIFSFYLCSNVMLNRREEYSRLAKLPIYQNILIVSISLVLAFSNTQNGLIIAQALGITLATLMSLYFNREYLLRGWSLPKMFGVMRTYDANPKYLLPPALLDSVSQHLPLFLILIYFDSYIGGQFAMSWRIMMIPMALIGVSISQVFFQRFSAQNDDLMGKKLELIKTWRILAFIGLPPLIALLFFGEEIFKYVLGAKWSEAGILASLLAPMFYVRLIFGPTSTSFMILGMQRYVFWYGSIILILRPLTLIVCFEYLGLYFGVMIYSLFEILQVIFYHRPLWLKLSR
jgi:O-antigen/teichoic acid export membrane protein